MERIIGNFQSQENDSDKTGEIIIDGNNIEFYLRGSHNPFVKTYIGSDGYMGYSVYVSGPDYVGNHRTLDNSSQ